MQKVLEECPGCRVPAGSWHQDGCGHARCPDCGEQYLLHDECTTRAAWWSGIHPGEDLAIEQGWQTWIVGLGWVPDAARPAVECLRGTVEWDPTRQGWLALNSRFYRGDCQHLRVHPGMYISCADCDTADITVRSDHPGAGAQL